VEVRLLLDTSAYVRLLGGQPAVAALVRKARRILVSPIVLGELLYGFRCGSRFEDNAEQLEAFLESNFVELLTVGRVTADRFGRITSLLRRKGTPIPTNDIWIAAQAMETGADLATFDAHFERVDGLALQLLEA
jgi:tRNA(fMet)-specific endonuclease VapC